MRHHSHSISIALRSRDLFLRFLSSSRALDSVLRRRISCVQPNTSLEASTRPSSMAVTVERVHLAMVHAAMPGLLPTPPEWMKLLPVLLTSPCAAAIMAPTPSPPNNPGRADAVDRWDASKDTPNKKSPPKTGRADAAERWDVTKITARSSSGKSSPPEEGRNKSSSSAGRASSCERWDANKKTSASSSSSSTSSSPTSRASSCAKWERTTNRPVSRGTSSRSAERWDAHKKPRPPLQAASGRDADNEEDDGRSSTGSNDSMEMDDEPQAQMMSYYAGPAFVSIAPPEPTMLPVPSFLVLPRFIAA